MKNDADPSIESILYTWNCRCAIYRGQLGGPRTGDLQPLPPTGAARESPGQRE